METLKPPTAPGGELSVALTKHRMTRSSKPGVGGIFSFFAPFLFCIICPQSLVLKFISSYTWFKLGNPKAAVRVAVDLQCWSL